MMWRVAKSLTFIVVAFWPLCSMFISLSSLSGNNLPIPQSSHSTVPTLNLAQALKLWEKGKFQDSLNLLTQIENPKAEVRFYRRYFEQFLQPKPSTIASPVSFAFDSKQCAQQILFVTGSVYSLAQAEVFKSKFVNDQRLKSLSICIQPTIWFDPEKVRCKENLSQNGRLACNMPQLAKSLKMQSFTHLVIFADKGKANVHNGIMFLDKQDTYDVFVHELAHFSGFVDEYPLRGELANQICNGVNAPNVVFRKVRGNNVDKDWQRSTELGQNIHFSKARTCDNHAVQAYKMDKNMTFMEYHDVGYIPKLYLLAWQQQLRKQQNSPSAHVNFAQYYESQNNQQESQYWRTKYQAYLKM
ncbi:hypothetical protein RS130_08555 [Paraglaciecola aquimarina]|uniref:Uncharacterized protein n=1 Tax=Paraglaciecola aquimarina TaxID=1235557 RepID=A0ABU3SVF3_9ALTE|nr:hypothetical protein [Paraglaciecola aquimarina]MDU0353975.1 hypothetical protein [Paraglaciecola aquimarina]